MSTTDYLVELDDAIHIGAPWEPRSSLCGKWDVRLVALDDPPPDGWAGCWTCLMAREWITGWTVERATQ